MRYVAQVAIGLLLVFISSAYAQPVQMNNQPFVYYGEEPWGGSYLGVDTQDITSDRLGPLHLKEEQGVEITMVDQDAPAGKAGLKEHDVILSINDQQVESVEQLRRLIREIPVGRTISVGISRDGQPMTIKAQLAKRNTPEMDFHFNPGMNIPPIHPNIPEIDVPNIIVAQSLRGSGMMIENLTPQLSEFFGVKGGNGVLVRSVEKGSRAANAGIRAGDVIVKINGSTVNDCSDFTRLLRSRQNEKTAVTVMRDRKEQVLTMTMPEKRKGSLDDGKCDNWFGEAACDQMKQGGAEIAALMPDMEKLGKQIAAEVERQKPEMEKLQKQIEQEVRSHQGEWKKQMEQMQRELKKHNEELQKQLHELEKHYSEI